MVKGRKFVDTNRNQVNYRIFFPLQGEIKKGVKQTKGQE